MQPKRLAAAAAVAVVVLASVGNLAEAAPGETELVSVVASGSRAAGDSNLRHGGGALSADGRYLVFHSYRASIAPGDDNGVADVFLRDLERGVTRLVSASVEGGVANAYAADASISADGRYVAFFSPADDLVRGVRSGAGDIFVWHRESGHMELASVGAGGQQGDDVSLESAISADGRYLAFTSFASNLARNDTNDRADVFLRDRQAGYTERVSVASDGRQANGDSWQPCVSADGRYVAFYSTATNLVPDDHGDMQDVFVRDRQTRRTLRASVAADGTPANGYSVQPTLSGNGRYVAFVSTATNLVPGDTNGRIDVFVKDLQSGHIERVSVSSTGNQGNGGSDEPALSADGRYVVFESFASNLVPGDTNASHDVFLHDRETGETRRVSVGTGGTEPDAASWTPSLSADGRFVAFRSDATNLDTRDDNRSSDVYVRDLGPNDSGTVAFTIKPSALDFGTRTVGSSTTQSFWLRNKSGTYLAIDGMALRGPDRAAFHLAHNCGTLVAPDDVCRISVTFRPATAGSMSAALKVYAAGDVVRTRELAGAAAW
ncbi:MAG TPA: choice-of-anchor D domain-containing protein [Steroidobacteraceae bacterium]|nr:choice-of-anchor D domain-containing protein [Steroidobacteraceae bacterium]